MLIQNNKIPHLIIKKNGLLHFIKCKYNFTKNYFLEISINKIIILSKILQTCNQNQTCLIRFHKISLNGKSR